MSAISTCKLFALEVIFLKISATADVQEQISGSFFKYHKGIEEQRDDRYNKSDQIRICLEMERTHLRRRFT